MTNSFDAGQVILCKIHLHKMIYKNISFLTCNIQKSGVDMKKVTIQDVARALGLSRNTVARALNNSDTVAYETRYMVIEKACEMGYLKVSPAVLNEFRAKGISETKTIIVLARREISIFWNGIIMGISDEINQNGCRLRFDFISEEDENRLVLPADFKEGVDGVILISVFSEQYLGEILKKGLPMVCLDCSEGQREEKRQFDVVISEGVESIRKITNHLIHQGIKRIGFIGDITYCRSIKDRYRGYLAALAENNLSQEDGIVAVEHTYWRYYNDADVEGYLKRCKEIPEAIVCANDAIAFLVIKALRERGLSVPQDVAVTGYDNQEELSSMEAFVTTVGVGTTRLGRRLACQLLFRLQHPELPRETVVVDAEILYRESSRHSM